MLPIKGGPLKDLSLTGPVFELRPPDIGWADRVRAGEHIASGPWFWTRPVSTDFEIWMLIGGSGRFILDGYEYLGSEGDIVLVTPGMKVQSERTGRGNMIIRFCHFDLGPHGLGHNWPSWKAVVHFLHHLAAEGSLASQGRLLLPACLPLDPDPQLLMAQQEMMRLTSEKPWGGRAAIYGRLLLLLSEISRKFVEQAAALPTEENSRDEQASRHVVRAVNFIGTHIHEPISIREVADALDLSDDYLGRLFREATGETVGEFILGRKLEIARAGLLSGSKSVKEISVELGFSDPRYFSRQFRKSEGLSPAKFRASSPKSE
jgi:AraC family transcriptional regulator, transcriptional activator of pobA